MIKDIKIEGNNAVLYFSNIGYAKNAMKNPAMRQALVKGCSLAFQTSSLTTAVSDKVCRKLDSQRVLDTSELILEFDGELL